jgi:hypothetical protein
MFSAMRRRLHLSPATVIAGLALVFAMTGGAYAAKKYLITSTKQISPSVLKSLQGKAGAAGANGAQGPAGPQGQAGAPGKDGANGKDGTNGKDGKDGVSVASTAFEGSKEPAGEPCAEQGGTELVSASGKTFACNGVAGKEGSPWTAGGTLPSGKTETGAFYGTYTTTVGPFKASYIPISFPIPLPNEIEVTNVTVIGPGGTKSVNGTGELTEGSKLIKAVAPEPATFFALGAAISGSHIPAGASITTIKSATELEISSNVESGGTASGVALSASAPPQCDDGVEPAVSSEHPEADPGHLCVFLAGTAESGKTTNPGHVFVGTTLNIGSPSSAVFGAAATGARIRLMGNSEAVAGEEMWGTFAVAAP